MNKLLPSRPRRIPPTPQHQDMDYLPLSSSSSSSSSEQSYRSVISAAFGRVICATVTCLLAIIGSSAGAVTGALIGIATESGLLRGAGVGAISGAVFSIEVVESSLDLWNSGESGIWSILYVLDIISSILNGRLVRDKVGPALQNAVQSEMSALTLHFPETPDIFETGGIGGLDMDEVEKLPMTKIAPEDNLGAGEEEKVCCSVCLQDFQLGEMVRKLPHCQHMFHLPCIDSWLIRHGTCPLCRRDI